MRRFFANSFLLTNYFNTILTVVVTTIDWFSPFEIKVKLLLSIVSLIELLLTFPFLYIAVADNKVPARTYLPLFALYLFPYFIIEDSMKFLMFVLSVSGLILTVYAGNERRKITGHFLGLFPKNFLHQENCQRSKAHWATSAIILCISVNFLGAMALVLKELVKENVFSGLSIKPDGLYTKVIRLEKDNKQAIVVGMMHIADKDFYKTALREVPTRGTLVLLEGITDRDEKLGDYDFAEEAATTFEKAKQGEDFESKISNLRHTVDADLDVSDMSAFASKYYIDLTHQASIFDSLEKSKEEREASKASSKQFMLERNENLMRVFDATESSFQTVAFTWGAGHQAYIADALIGRGYKKISEKELLAFSFFGSGEPSEPASSVANTASPQSLEK
jgi:hypothetical protein